jgi:hypothetical protein
MLSTFRFEEYCNLFITKSGEIIEILKINH